MSLAERQQMAELASQCFHRRYDMQQCAKAIISLFQTAISAPVDVQPE
jgi:hypothetical protein